MSTNTKTLPATEHATGYDKEEAWFHEHNRELIEALKAKSCSDGACSTKESGEGGSGNCGGHDKKEGGGSGNCGGHDKKEGHGCGGCKGKKEGGGCGGHQHEHKDGEAHEHACAV